MPSAALGLHLCGFLAAAEDRVRILTAKMATARITPVKSETPAAETPAALTVFERFGWLVRRVNAEIPVPGFTVGDLLKLAPGAVVQTATPAGKDVPVRINGILLGSGKFEVIGDRLAIRITEFA